MVNYPLVLLSVGAAKLYDTAPPRSWFYWFVNSPYSSFLIGRFVVLLLLILAIALVWRRCRAFGVSITLLLVLGIAVFSVLKSYSPDGIYADLLSHESDSYFLLSNGKIEWITKNGSMLHWRYEKTKEGWIVTTSDGEVQKLKFSVFGIQMTQPDTGRSTDFFPRRIIPFVRPEWMPKWLQ